GELGALHEKAKDRVEHLRERGLPQAYLYGAPSGDDAAPNPATGTRPEDLGGLNAFFLLTSPPETYNLPAAPVRAAPRIAAGMLVGLMTASTVALAALGVLAYA